MWVFGTGLAAECVVAQLGNDSIEGICIDDEYFYSGSKLLGYEIVPLSEVISKSSTRELFVATGYKNLNRNRALTTKKLRELGFSLVNIIADACSLKYINLGENNFIMDGANIQPHVEIKDNVFVWSGATVCHHVRIGSNVWVTAGSTIAGNTSVGSNIFIGANATIASGLTLGSNIFIGAGSLVTSDLPSNSVVIAKGSEYLGVPADTFVKYLELKGNY
jgi:sugar O-acyltransferase (sialic acid O-acetyltransferase NeuD family)